MWSIYLFCVIPLILFIIGKLYLSVHRKHKNVCIVVLGDLGRSPRMQYHAISFVKEGFTVDFIGYPGSSPLKQIKENSRIQIYYLRPPPKIEDKLSRSFYYMIKTIWQTFNLLWVLFNKHIPSYILIQNPPAIPTIPVCWFYSIVVGSQFIIDWHNYAYTLMALSLKDDHFLVKFAKIIEIYFGSKAHYSFCVSQAMKEDLQKKWQILSKVLYDRPGNQFQPISLAEKHAFLLKLSEKYHILKGPKENSTVFTECIENEIHLPSKRLGLIVSSTSWTEDEDFSILLNALQEYENAIVQNTCNLPDLICIITGKGPLKEFYTAIIKLKNWEHVTVLTPWLESEDYPKMLASADLGICLHTSSSGLDLPMKIIDMFGCKLPVCAYNFKCLSELVKHNENGMIFSSDKELAVQLKSWFENFPNNDVQHKLNKKFQEELHKFQEIRWHGQFSSLEDITWLNNRPIIGVLAQELSYNMRKYYSTDRYHSYIAASYVKFIEGAGARVVPIWIGKNESYYRNILNNINGVLWPGGATLFDNDDGYADAGYLIYKIARRMNKNGDYFPIFGICLGFELLTYVVANRTKHRIDCDSINEALPLEFTPDFRKGRMFNKASSDIIDILKTKNVTSNFHQYCVTKQKLQKNTLIILFTACNFIQRKIYTNGFLEEKFHMEQMPLKLHNILQISLLMKHVRTTMNLLPKMKKL
ncbi:PREDICTED: chitobiosyldiphosphodolichol beta-mannosyltransferase-like isoform X2 [Eufriesea mexicana]|uniref:chitobiosyldiphosphodolichol beta-mannosyltransferase-like isoform X2 n=1 Tax=Eufriesea mexicana TaxID=516756 RepID=UPI00083C422E|nr:PREDICTED: chitobiosyldiphosphodolichol beta-mannosyltransferase-like isoform X2 [Eufriesea mexicana]